MMIISDRDMSSWITSGSKNDATMVMKHHPLIARVEEQMMLHQSYRETAWYLLASEVVDKHVPS